MNLVTDIRRFEGEKDCETMEEIANYITESFGFPTRTVGVTTSKGRESPTTAALIKVEVGYEEYSAFRSQVVSTLDVFDDLRYFGPGQADEPFPPLDTLAAQNTYPTEVTRTVVFAPVFHDPESATADGECPFDPEERRSCV